MIKELEGIGLTNGEVKVYVALLELGSSTTGTIIKKAKVSRSKVYEMLDKLLEKGLVSYVIKEKAKYFEAANPNEIVNYIQKRKKELQDKETTIKKIIPLLEERQKISKVQQTATVFEGIKGIKTLYNEILSTMKKGEEYYAIAVEPEVSQSKDFETFIRNYHLKRAEKGIKVKLLADKKLKPLKTLQKSKLLQLKFYDQEIPTATLIYKNNVATFVWGKTPSAIVMRSPIIANRYKSFFRKIWSGTAP